MGKIFDEVNEKVFNTNTDFEELQGLCIDLATRLEKAEQQGLSAGNAGYKAVADIIEECASICERPFYKLAPSMVEINPESHEPINQLISQRDLFSFINDIIKLRTNEIRKLKATAFIT